MPWTISSRTFTISPAERLEHVVCVSVFYIFLRHPVSVHLICPCDVIQLIMRMAVHGIAAYEHASVALQTCSDICSQFS
jgi:hypothetical protein